MTNNRWTTLITVEELAAVCESDRVAVVDCRFDLADPSSGKQQYAAGHLPGAVYADLDEDLSSPITQNSGRHPLPKAGALADRLGAWGIDSQAQIVAYDASGGAFASRLWWLARWLGHHTVAVLDGGWPAWGNAGQPTTTAIPNPAPRQFVPTVDNSMWVSTNELAEGLENVRLIDAREAERFRGEAEPIDPVAGHVPGALNLPWKGNLDSDGRFLGPDELATRFADAKNSATSQQLASMCGSGVTACHNLLAMEIVGIRGAKLYAGSWSEWIRDERRPVATGAE